MSETGYTPEFKLGDEVVRRYDFLNWVNGTGSYKTRTIEAITISADKTLYHISSGGTHKAPELIPAKDAIMRGIEHLQARQTALIEILSARGDSK